MLIQPWIMKSRLLYRDILIHEKDLKKYGWDETLPENFRNIWLKLCEEMFQLETLEFDRSIVPPGYNPDEDPTLVLFSDGSAKRGLCCRLPDLENVGWIKKSRLGYEPNQSGPVVKVINSKIGTHCCPNASQAQGMACDSSSH